MDTVIIVNLHGQVAMGPDGLPTRADAEPWCTPIEATHLTSGAMVITSFLGSIPEDWEWVPISVAQSKMDEDVALEMGEILA